MMSGRRRESCAEACEGGGSHCAGRKFVVRFKGGLAD